MGPWFTNQNYLVTSDPINVHHMLSKCFDNYVKGHEYHEIFEAFGDGIFNADSETWKYNRSLFHSVFKQRDFELFEEKIIRNKLERSLIPMLDHVQQKGSVVDLQDVFNRFTFDNICSVVLGCDPNCLSIDLPDVACEKAFNEIEEGIFYRHKVPSALWKLQKWLQIGEEKKFTENVKIIHQMLYSKIKSKKDQMQGEQQFDLLSILLKQSIGDGKNPIDDENKFLRDTSINLLSAGRDTISSALTWFFWLVATHPFVEAKILEEIKENLPSRKDNWKYLGVEGLNKLIYLHAALCEVLRLYPPVPFEHKSSLKSDVLPSGHMVESNSRIVYSLYSIGRMGKIWGEDCLEFKPERWISKKGGIIHVPSYKFIAFNAGPRTCLGKDISFIEMKMIAAAILLNYQIQVVEDHPIIPSISVVLHMKHGLKVNVKKRSI
jgi:cytochrome P450